jgi:hypothetical protein
MNNQHSSSTFADELAATRRQLRRLEKLAVALKRCVRTQPRKLSPLFRLRAIQQRLAECEALLIPAKDAQPRSPSSTSSPSHPPQAASAVVIPFQPDKRRDGTRLAQSVKV